MVAPPEPSSWRATVYSCHMGASHVKPPRPAKARIIGDKRLTKSLFFCLTKKALTKKKRTSVDRAFAPKLYQRFKRIWARLLGSILCADWLAFVWPLNEDKGRTIQLFKLNNLLFLLLLLLKEVGSARRESDIHPIIPKTQPTITTYWQKFKKIKK